ncbi:MAG: type I-C CRISPR-associated protein Cas5 [Candidatus Riflebacteria bacterium]|nr:type I-C CRISPR-associated protein Cas5 [Candidatus Riflebacteria bacterium]
MTTDIRTSRVFSLRVWGENACFTRPEMKVERVSYDVMTPSAARGVLEAILWKPALRWQVTRIDVLNPIRWTSVRRNEVGAVMSDRTDGIFIEDKRQQRAGLFLRDVAYLVHAFFSLTPRAGAEDTIRKFEEMFVRRAERGQCFHRPCLGCREFAADFELWPSDMNEPKAIDESRELGFMLYDVAHDQTRDQSHVHTCTEGCRPAFFRASLDRGSMKVPPFDSSEVRR